MKVAAWAAFMVSENVAATSVDGAASGSPAGGETEVTVG